ncbi:metalloregulator ArsR/SmtB family transcription factor [Synechococcus elongatus IITB7]
MADPLRLQVLILLSEQELCVCDLCDRLLVKQPKLSFHLRQLREAGLIQARPQGRWTYYSLCPSRFASLQVWLQRFSQAQPAIAATCQE